MNLKIVISSIIIMLSMMSCGHGSKSGSAVGVVDSLSVDSASLIIPEYARGFNVTYSDDVILLDISDPENKESQTFHYALVSRGSSGEIPEGYVRIDTPVKSVICMTSLQLSNFIKLGLTDLVTGITSTRHLFNEKVNAQLKSGKTHKIGIEGNFDNEVIIALDPDMIFISPFKRGGYDAIRNVDIPLVPHLGYKELTPLGQAEWIKVVGLLTGHEQKANEMFRDIAERYNVLKARVDSVDNRPVVFSGEMQGGHWYAVGGRSFLARIFEDAGADYFLKDNMDSGGVTLDFEVVYKNAADADYWRIVNSFDGSYGYDALRDKDSRYVDFKAYKNRGVIYCNMREVPFYERMPVEPDEVLADFISVFHPGILPDHKPRYYHLLK